MYIQYTPVTGIVFSARIPRGLTPLSTSQVLVVKGEKRFCGERGRLKPWFALTWWAEVGSCKGVCDAHAVTGREPCAGLEQSVLNL